MAVLDRRNPNLDDFVGLNWSCWADRVNILPSDAGSNAEEGSGKYGRNRSETMALRKEDMHTYGHCPAHDEICLVVCSHCGQVVKPQAFEKHCEKRHGHVTKTCSQPSPLTPRARPSRALSSLSSARERQHEGRCHEAIASSSSSGPPPVRQHRPTKDQKEPVSFPTVEKFPQEKPPLPQQSSSTTRPRVPPWHSGALPPAHSSSSTPPSSQKPTAGQCSESQSPLRGTRSYSRMNKNINKKECDLNKHCGLLDPERKKPCSWELICNNDSVQKPLGRTQIYEQLAVEQRIASAGPDMEQLLVKSKDKEKHLESFEEKITTQGSKCNFNNNCHILRRPRDPLGNFPEEEGDSTVEVEVQLPYPFNQSLLSSGESEEDEQEEARDLPATPRHPKPLGLCTFGCHTYGCSTFTFDRRWHHLRFALSAMLEHHVSTHLWKKMPQVTSGLRSLHVTPTVGSTVRTGARSSKSTGSLRLESTSPVQLENKSSQHNAHNTKPPSSATSACLGSLAPSCWATEQGRQHHPVGQPSKAHLRKMELTGDGSAAQKAAKESHSGEDKSSQCIRDHPLHEKGQPHLPSSQGPVNGTFSHGKKPCPPPAPIRSPRSRSRTLGIQQKVVGCDHAGLTQKRKGSESSPLSSSHKCQRLSSPSRSSLVAWKGENIGDKLGAWRKDSAPKDQYRGQP